MFKNASCCNLQFHDYSRASKGYLLWQHYRYFTVFDAQTCVRAVAVAAGQAALVPRSATPDHPSYIVPKFVVTYEIMYALTFIYS